MSDEALTSPQGPRSQGHVSLSPSDLVADSETAEQRGQRCCFHGWVESTRGQRLSSLCLFPREQAPRRQREDPSHSLGCTHRQMLLKINLPYFDIVCVVSESQNGSNMDIFIFISLVDEPKAFQSMRHPELGR